MDINIFMCVILITYIKYAFLADPQGNYYGDSI